MAGELTGGGRAASIWLQVVVLSLGLLGFNIFVGVTRSQQAATAHWPVTTGRITQNEMRFRQEKNTQVDVPFLEYSYLVSGREYRSHDIRLTGSSLQGAPRPVLDHYAKGGTFPVAFNPADPASAVLEPGLAPLDLKLAFYQLPFLCITGFFAAALAEVRRRGGTLVGPRHLRTPGRLVLSYAPSVLPPSALACMAGLLSGFCAFISVIAVDVPTWSYLLQVLAAQIAWMLVTYAFFRSRAKPPVEITLELTPGLLSVPTPELRTLKMADIRSIELVPVAVPDNATPVARRAAEDTRHLVFRTDAEDVRFSHPLPLAEATGLKELLQAQMPRT